MDFHPILKTDSTAVAVRDGQLIVDLQGEGIAVDFGGERVKVAISTQETEQLRQELTEQLGAIELTPGPEGPQGEAGPAGEKGDTGEPGAIGPAGAIGNAGPSGPPGAPGLPGPQGIPGAQGSLGATGERGPQGPTGPQGEHGPQGERGLTGNTGLQGVPGPAGPKGDKGDRGDAGPAGPRGEQGPQGPAGAGDMSRATFTISAQGNILLGSFGITNHMSSAILTVRGSFAQDGIATYALTTFQGATRLQWLGGHSNDTIRLGSASQASGFLVNNGPTVQNGGSELVCSLVRIM
jgi:hypothetical protein